MAAQKRENWPEVGLNSLVRYTNICFRYMPGGYRKPRKDKRKPEKFTGAQVSSLTCFVLL